MDLPALLRHWDIGAIRNQEHQSGRVTRLETDAGQTYYLKRHGSQRTLAEAPVLQFLNQQGIRTELPLLTRAGQELASDGQDSYALYAALPGRHIDQVGWQPEERAWRLGAAIGQLHRGWSQYPLGQPSAFPHTNILTHIGQWDRIIREQKDRLGFAELTPILDDYARVMPELYPHLTEHLIHRDSHPSNILFDESGQPGFVDFELLRTAVRLFDPCYCSTSLLVAIFHDEEQRRTWPSLFRQVISGYDSVCPLTAAERQALKHVVTAIQAIFIGWWARGGHDEQAQLNARMLCWIWGQAVGY